MPWGSCHRERRRLQFIVDFPRLYSAGLHVAAVAARTQNNNQDDEENTMSLPRSDYDPRRVCLNPFPFLNNINLGKQRRTFGVYVAGGLVSLACYPFPNHAH